jgi:hypothetical protein
MVDLREDSARVARLWDGSRASRVPLALAAALTFHRTRRNGEDRLSHLEYASALDIAAVALSCLAPIYAADARAAIDLARQRFSGGASEVLAADGAVLAPLTIARRDVLDALATIERSGIEYLAPRAASP